jgi:nucleoside-diphosphate-sugar epimerase
VIEHLNRLAVKPSRVVILGSSGFIGQALAKHLQHTGIECLALSSKELNLIDTVNAAPKLAALLQPTDAIVFLSVVGPNRGHDTTALINNLQMAETVGLALQQKPCAQLIYVSSEAVYNAKDPVLNPDTLPSPNNSYGVMHLAREIALQDMLDDSTPLLILRVTQVYGHACTHNAYGPNRFIRKALAENKIELFGLGEENRDFICITDVVQIIDQALKYRSFGLTNVATGKSITYKHLAEMLQEKLSEQAVEVICKPRVLPITHRFFNIDDLLGAYPQLHLSSLTAGLDLMLSLEAQVA